MFIILASLCGKLLMSRLALAAQIEVPGAVRLSLGSKRLHLLWHLGLLDALLEQLLIGIVHRVWALQRHLVRGGDQRRLTVLHRGVQVLLVRDVESVEALVEITIADLI